jgi:endonuclease-8
VPEGDTIHRAAERLRPVLVGRELVRFEAPRARGPRPRPGTAIVEVEAYGKHLLVRFADGHVLRTHLGMTGRWDVYRAGERWRRPAHLARAVVGVAEHEAVCFSAPTVELTRERPGAAARPATIDHLGPDLCRPDADLEVAVSRMATIPDPSTGIAEVLLDQRVAAGVGNVFKSEVLWACRVHPLTPVSALSDDERRRLVATAARQLRASLATGQRTTVTGRPGTLAAYGRGGRPCSRCGTPIAWQRTGAQPRSTYWCPTCQPAR